MVGGPNPLILLLLMQLSVNEGTRQRGTEPGPRVVYKWFAAKASLGNNWLKLLIMGKARQILSTRFFFSKKCEKNVPIIKNDAKHTRTIEDGVASLQLFSCHHKADSRIICITCF